MRITVQLFASLRERAAVAELALDGLPEGLDISGLKRELEARCPALGDLTYVKGAIGTSYAPDATRLSDGARVFLLPPVSGG
jgi:molybdopterin converting factor small subunit